MPINASASVIYKAKLNGYYFIYDSDNFINVYSEDLADNKAAQCVYRYQTTCTNRKDFEMEVIHACAKVSEM
jgi:hypothetical protein